MLVYLYDILVYSKTADNHEKYLYEVFSWLIAHKLQTKCTKCKFGHTYVYFFGQIIMFDKLQVYMEKLSAVKDWLMPSYIRDA